MLKHIGATIDNHLCFQTEMKIMAVGIKIIETVQNRFPTTVLTMLFHALVFNHLE